MFNSKDMSDLSLMSNFKDMSDLSLMFNPKDMSDLNLMSNFKYMSDLSLMFNPKDISDLSLIFNRGAAGQKMLTRGSGRVFGVPIRSGRVSPFGQFFQVGSGRVRPKNSGIFGSKSDF